MNKTIYFFVVINIHQCIFVIRKYVISICYVKNYKKLKRIYHVLDKRIQSIIEILTAVSSQHGINVIIVSFNRFFERLTLLEII